MEFNVQAIQGHTLVDQWKGDKGLHNNIRLFPKQPEIQRPKALKIDVFDYPTVV